MLLHKNTYQKQSEFASFCRGGNTVTSSVVIQANAKHYPRLIKNIFLDTLASAYPLTHDLLAVEEWNELVFDFLQKHPCCNPQVWYMPVELYEYVKKNNLPVKDKYKHLTELLHFEWLELEVYMMGDENQDGEFSDNADLTTNRIAINAETRIAVYEYPIHLKNAQTISENDKGQYFVSLHRHPENGKVLFTDLSLPHVLLLQYLIENSGASYDVMLSIFMQQVSKTEAEKALLQFLTTGINNKLFLLLNNQKQTT